jgi:hypothetical protein
LGIFWLVTDPEKAENLSRFRIYSALECNLLQNPRLIRKHRRAYVNAMDQADTEQSIVNKLIPHWLTGAYPVQGRGPRCLGS